MPFSVVYENLWHKLIAIQGDKPNVTDMTLPVIFDGHNDVLLKLHRAGGLAASATFVNGRDGAIDTPSARAGGFGGGFFAVYAGMILKPESEADTAEILPEEEVVTLPPVAFVEIDPLVISLGNGSGSRHLRFRASLEVEPQYQEDVTRLIPRVLDVLNSYLRAVEMRDIEDPSALLMIRAQMLRRIQIVTGGDRVRDLLIMEFILN